MNVVYLVVRLYEAAPPATRLIAQVAILIGCVGLVVSLVSALRRRRAAAAVREVVDRAQEPSDDGSADTLDARWDELTRVWATRGFTRALDRLKGARRRPTGGPEEVWSGAFDRLSEEDASRESVIRGIATAAVLIGLLGTVIGFADLSSALVILITGAPGAPAAVDSTSTAVDLHTRLAGVFASTVAGIVGSLMILVIGVPLFRTASDHWLSAVEDAGRIILIPALPRPLTHIQDLLMGELERRMDAVVSVWYERLQEPATALTQAAEHGRRAAEAAVGALEGVRVSVSDLRELGRSATLIQTAATSMEQTSKTFVDTSEQFGDVVASLERTLPPLSASLHTVSRSLETLEVNVGKGSQAVVDAGSGLRESVQGLAEAFSGLEASVTSRHERESAFLEETRGAVSMLEQRLEGLRSLEEAVSRHINETNAALSSIGLEIGRFLGPLNETLAQGIRETFGKLLSEHSTLLFEAVGRIQASATKTEDQLSLVEVAREELLRSARAATASAEALGAGAREIRSSVPDPRPVQLAIERVGEALDRIAREGTATRVDPSLVDALRALARGSEGHARPDAMGPGLDRIHDELRRLNASLSREPRRRFLE